MPDLYAMARAARADAIELDTAAARRLMAVYGEVYRSLNAQAKLIAAKIEAARVAGDPVSRAWLYQDGRIQALKAQALEELTAAAERAEPIIRETVGGARSQAASTAAEMVRTATPLTVSTVNLPIAAINQAAAFGSPGTPLALLLAEIAPAGAASIESAILNGIASGSNPRVVAREIARSLGGHAVRALTISRTEIMRAHREGARDTYRQNAGVIRGWVWVAGLGSRTCASCWAQNGTEHPLDEPMATHPNCRCVAAPLSVRWRDLGIDLPEPAAVPYGPDVFASSSERVQRSVLGPSKFDAYRRGEVRLEDFVARRQSPTWGPSTSQAGLDEARSNAAVRQAA